MDLSGVVYFSSGCLCDCTSGYKVRNVIDDFQADTLLSHFIPYIRLSSLFWVVDSQSYAGEAGVGHTLQ